MQKDSSGFPSHHPLPDFMKEKQAAGNQALGNQALGNQAGVQVGNQALGNQALGDQALGNQACNQAGNQPSGNSPRTRTKRAFFHDYCSRGFYLITATALPGSPRFSEIPDYSPADIRKGEMIIPNHSSLGETIRHEILDIPAHHPEMRILRFVVMPDHIHFVLEVKERLKRMLGRELAGFFGACSKASSSLQGLKEVKTLFAPYFERIIFSHEQLDRAIKYVEDNPRRYILKKKNPDLFRRYLHLEIAGHEYAAFGNIFLLRHFDLIPVRIHRRWSEAEFAEYHEECIRRIKLGAIPVSPFIHEAERAIEKEAQELDCPVIKLSEQGFEERFKPYGKDFEACAEGRLLLLAPWPENGGRKSTAGYAEFHAMNDLAAAIASMPADTRLAIKN